MPQVLRNNAWERQLKVMPYFLPPMLGLLFMQTLPAPLNGDWPALGVGGGLAVWMFWMYREDAKRHDKSVLELKQVHEVRLVELTKNFMTIVQENTRAITTLTEKMHFKDK